VFRRKIAVVRQVSVGYSWIWGPLLHPQSRVAVKCQLEFEVFFFFLMKGIKVSEVLGETEGVTGGCMGSPCNPACFEARSTCQCTVGGKSVGA